MTPKRNLKLLIDLFQNSHLEDDETLVYLEDAKDVLGIEKNQKSDKMGRCLNLEWVWFSTTNVNQV